MKEITTWRDFAAYIPKALQNPFNERCYRRIFSLVARNRWKMFSDEDSYRIEYHKNGYIFWTTGKHLRGNMRFVKFPEKIVLNCLTCVSTEYQVGWTGMLPEVLVDKDGKMYTGYYRSLRDIVNSGIQNLTFAGSKYELEKTYYNNTEYRKQVDYRDAGNYATYLVVKDHLWYKRGQIIYTADKYEYYKRSPKALLPGGNWWSEYHIGYENIACDLSLITVEELNKVTYSNSCSKQQFGCHRGCTSSCLTESNRGYLKKLVNFFIKTKQELGV